MADLADLLAVDVADVHKGDTLAGHLLREEGAVVFRYLDGYEGPEVATTLPRNRDHHGGPPGAVPPFFAGLLPEGRRLVLLQRALKTSADDELSQVLAVGGDTIGDVRVVASGEDPVSPAPVAELSDRGSVHFRDLLAASVGGVDRVGVPGVQEKLSARMQTLPVRGPRDRLSDAILKVEPTEFPHLVDNEVACLDAALAAGLDVPHHEVATDAAGIRGLVVRRFDRVVEGDRLMALAQEDGCQVLGLWPADKYRTTTERVVHALASVCRAPVPAALRLWEQVAFSFLAGNGDLHAKNLSVRWTPHGAEPTPVYDVVCTYPYGDTATMALPLMGVRNPDAVRRAHLLEAGETTGVPARALDRAIDRLLARTEDLPDRLAAIPFRGTRSQKARRYLQGRRDRLT